VANQQATPTEPEIAWLAGIIEGEGTLMMSLWQHNGPDRKPKVGLQVKVYNSDAGIIRKAVSLLEMLAIGHHLKEREMPPMAKPGGDGVYAPTAPMLTVTISKLDCVYRVLKAIRPWIFGEKSARADLMLAFLEKRFERTHASGEYQRRHYNADEIRIVYQFYKNGRRGDLTTVERVLNELEQSAA
jgi:hypothetical protein